MSSPCVLVGAPFVFCGLPPLWLTVLRAQYSCIPVATVYCNHTAKVLYSAVMEDSSTVRYYYTRYRVSVS
jgi:hypothetical protein